MRRGGNGMEGRKNENDISPRFNRDLLERVHTNLDPPR